MSDTTHPVETDRYAELVELATRVFGNKRTSDHMKILAYNVGDKGLRLVVPDHLREWLGIEANARVALIEIPNGNVVLVPTEKGNRLSRGEHDRGWKVIIRDIIVAGEGPVPATIAEGIAYFPKGTLTPLEA